MSFWSSFKRLFGGATSFSYGCEVFDTDEYIDKIYDNPSFTIAEKKKADATKVVEWGVFKRDKEGNLIETTNKIINQILFMPNSINTMGDFLEYWMLWYDGKDNGILMEKVVGLSFAKPDLLLHNPDNFNVYQDSGRIVRIEILNCTPSRNITDQKELENFMWIKQPNPYNDNSMGNTDTSAQSGRTLQRGMALAGSYVYNAWQWNNSVVRNSGRRSGVYTSDRPIPPDEEEKFQQKVQAKNNMNDKGKALLVSGNVKFTPDDSEAKDSDWNLGEDKAHKKVVSSLGVAPELTGSGESTYQNRKEARKELYEEKLIAFYKDVAGRLNIFLEPWLKEGEFIWFKTDSIPALQTNVSEGIKALEPAKDRLSVNEYRAELSDITGKEYQSVKNGDTLLVPSMAVPLNDVVAGEKEPPEDEE